MRRHPAILIALLLSLGSGLSVQAAAGGKDGPPQDVVVRELEGIVISLGEQVGEGDLSVVTVLLDSDESLLALAPAPVLQEIGFQVEVGDSLRVRFFPIEGDGPAGVQRVLNLSRGQLVRLRTLHQDPLWDGSGRWQGGPGGPRWRGGRHGGDAPRGGQGGGNHGGRN